MAKEIDVRGLSCPQPVFLVKKAIDAGEKEIVATCDDKVARDNIKRLVENYEYDLNIEEKDKEFILKITGKK